MNNYNRVASTLYAKEYSLTPNSQFKYFSAYGNIGGDCTNFISQCLFYGGAKMITFGNNQWWYNSNKLYSSTTAHTCSTSWSLAHALYWQIKSNEKHNLLGIKGIEVTSPTALELGDLIFFENINKVIYHSTIVTEIYEEELLVSQHSPEASNISYERRNVSKYHFVKIHF